MCVCVCMCVCVGIYLDMSQYDNPLIVFTLFSRLK